MCGIIGYIGEKDATPILIDGLRRLEYRGYDSAGVAVIGSDGALSIRRSKGKLSNLENSLREQPVSGAPGVGHTRWATHGRPSEENAHPHCVDGVAVVHNGIIENHLALKDELAAGGSQFSSETDTELVAHLVARAAAQGVGLEQAVRVALSQVEGAYALVIISQHEPDKIIVAKNASPLVLGLADGENYIASDIPAILSHTRDIIFLDEGEMAVVTADQVRVTELESGAVVEKKVTHVTWSPVMAEKGGYKHFMLKEIFEQPRAITDTIRGRLSLEQSNVFFEHLPDDPNWLRSFDRLAIIACGTSWHAGLLGKYFLESFCKLPVEVDLASEYRYREPIVDERTLFVSISQSGETADTLAALKLARERGAQTLTICNVVDSSIARLSDAVIYTHAGPEIGVASTKAFTTQIVALLLLTIAVARARESCELERITELCEELAHLPTRMEELLTRSGEAQQVAAELFRAANMLYLGRGVNYPIALEGALKIKEISYIHAEGYAAGEMKHGPIALIDEQLPVVVVMPKGSHYEKIFSNLAEVQARGAKVIAVGSESDHRLCEFSDHLLVVPDVPWYIQPLLTTVPLQLLAYYVADLKGTDVDQPRNLAKSVTVE